MFWAFFPTIESGGAIGQPISARFHTPIRLIQKLMLEKKYCEIEDESELIEKNLKQYYDFIHKLAYSK